MWSLNTCWQIMSYVSVSDCYFVYTVFNNIFCIISVTCSEPAQVSFFFRFKIIVRSCPKLKCSVLMHGLVNQVATAHPTSIHFIALCFFLSWTGFRCYLCSGLFFLVFFRHVWAFFPLQFLCILHRKQFLVGWMYCDGSLYTVCNIKNPVQKQNNPDKNWNCITSNKGENDFYRTV